MARKDPTPQWMREEVFKRDNYTCQYCGTTTGPFHADHVYPYSKGGETTLNNLVTSCSRCNGKKSNKVGVWPRKIVQVVETVTVTETVTVKKQPIAGRAAIFLAVQILMGGMIYGGLTHTNYLVTLIPALAVFGVGFALLLFGV